ncbi:hypothetical protein CHS0354_021772 [Potamilus streckersoni]|uniref:TIR domain-containing protein n=1 Tax=Potamilus streckersoni TaxID=2493646 RepID=A0AAE0S485_9BIVA|nr:hypothetical protein CHS0354_021772 [Potamilus streckersoni]
MTVLKMIHFLLILVLYTIVHNTDVQSELNSCIENYGELSCENITSEQAIPLVALAGVHTVCINGSKTIKKLESSPFQNISWQSVSELYISNFLALYSINKDFLAGLRGLKLLSISSCQYLKEIPEELLKETPELEALYLDWLPSMNMSQVEKLLRNSVPNLRYLSLIALNTLLKKIFLIGNDFIEAVGPKNLTFLDMSQSYFGGASNFEYVLQNSLFHLQYLNISNTPFYTTTPTATFRKYLKLDVIDLSNCILEPLIRMDATPTHPVVITKHDCPQERVVLRYYIMSNLKTPWDHPRHINAIFNFTKSEGCIVERVLLVDLSKNRIKKLNITLFGRLSYVNLMKFDLSNNSMEYLSPSILSALPALKIINFDGNALSRMEDIDDFKTLFESMKSIEIINLRDNGLTRLPVNFGQQNKELRILDLKGNHLRHFQIAVGSMEKIVLIDLSDNYIDVLSNQIVDDIQYIYSIQQSDVTWPRERDNVDFYQEKNIRMAYAYNSTRNVRLSQEENGWSPESFTVDISGNFLQCTCDNLYFAKWIISSDVNLLRKESLNCMFYGQKLDMKEDMVDKIVFRCRLPKITAIIVTVCITCFICITLLFYFIFRRRKKACIQHRIRYLKKKIKEGKLSYIVFVSYCSNDQDIAYKWIVPVINDYLKDNLEASEDLAVTGLETIIPGMLLTNEIYRCIEEALVVVLVVTENFLESDWCNLEGLIASQYKIPLVILIEEGTRCENKSRTIKHALKHFGRAEWSTKNGQFRIRPSMNVICDGILSIAAESLFSLKEKEKSKRTRGQQPLLENHCV